MRIDKTILARQLAKLADVMPPKTLENCQGILFRNNKLIGNNQKLSVEVALGTDTDEAFLIPPSVITMISKLPSGEIEIRAKNESMLEIRCGAIKNTVSTGKYDKYPTQDVNKNGESDSLTMDGDILVQCIRNALYATSKDESRPIHCGILFESSEGNLNVVSCDGYRLVWQKEESDSDFKFVIPADAAKKLVSLSPEGEVQISHNAKEAVFACDEFTVYTRLLEGEFVNYKNVFPNYSNEVSVDQREFLNALSRCMVYIDSKSKVPMRLTFSGNSLTFYLKTAVSEYEETIGLDSALEDDLTIGFNATYLHDALKNINADNVYLGVSSSTAPMTIRHDNVSALVLPVRLSAS